MEEKRETKKDYEFTKFKPRKTAKTAYTPSVSGVPIVCVWCKTTTRAGTLKADKECPFCHKPIFGRGR